MATDEEKPSRHWLLFLVAIFLGLPLLALCGLTLVGPPTGETWVVTFAVLAMVIGGMIAPWGRHLAWGARAGFFVLFLVIMYRFFAAESGTTVRDETGPDASEGRWIDRIVPERDVALGGTTLLMALGAMGPPEPGLQTALRDGYDRMRRAEGPVPSAIVGTFLFGQSPEAHSLIRIAPADRFNPPEAVVLFLHGFIGNITVACWHVAQAANPVGLDVVCPSTGWQARWAEPDGRATVDATIAALRAHGVQRIYMAGLSAGAIGLSRMARDLDVEGVILISGASSRARPAAVPTLVLQGGRDPRTPPAPARAYARAVGRRARYVEAPEAGHWMILSHHELVQENLRRWLAEREGLGTIHGATHGEADAPE